MNYEKTNFTENLIHENKGTFLDVTHLFESTDTMKYVRSVKSGAIDKVEKHFNVLLPSDYKDALSRINGGRPVNNLIDVNGNERVVNSFIDIIDVIKCAKYTDNVIIPFAADPFGNYFGFNTKTMKVEFWKHELSIVEFVADSFNNFEDKLHK